MPESIKKIEPVVAMAVAALLVAASMVAGAVPLQNVYAGGEDGGGDGGDGGEGCTPGFWKTHTDEWPAPYEPSTLFEDVFGESPLDDDLTLLQALNLGGGGLNALARAAVAALLNAASDEIDFEFTVEEVIAMFQEAIETGNIEDVKDEFDRENNRGC